ncbi:MAG: DUF1232 domain-containing protein [Aphanocapsa sp. GSE-SYN-MK-11-07L]|jgi:uncharacterized membrane protein YkvA (DUF1232 family)|nr:DUF1232 domain-containing protein [Aphanocapsa sp. GSE-SYN-MK-11-07L]
MKFPLNAFYAWYSQTLRHPKYRWFIIIASLVYLFSPLDISPDIIPIIGQLDDIAILTLLVTEISQMLTDRLKKRQPNQTMADSTPAQATSEPIEVEAVSL